jgi:hypothetical protein
MTYGFSSEPSLEEYGAQGEAVSAGALLKTYEKENRWPLTCNLNITGSKLRIY